MKKGRVIFGVVLVFALGVLCGVLATRLLCGYRSESILSSGPQHREEAIVKRLDRRLDLDDRQEEQVRAIVHETVEQIRAVRSTTRPQTEAIIAASQAKISALLTAEQRKKYDRMIAERKERLHKERW
jgi:hypothetical protein